MAAEVAVAAVVVVAVAAALLAQVLQHQQLKLRQAWPEPLKAAAHKPRFLRFPGLKLPEVAVVVEVAELAEVGVRLRRRLAHIGRMALWNTALPMTSCKEVQRRTELPVWSCSDRHGRNSQLSI